MLKRWLCFYSFFLVVFIPTAAMNQESRTYLCPTLTISQIHNLVVTLDSSLQITGSHSDGLDEWFYAYSDTSSIRYFVCPIYLTSNDSGNVSWRPSRQALYEKISRMDYAKSLTEVGYVKHAGKFCYILLLREE